MRAIRTYVWLPAVCALAVVQACGASSTTPDDGTAGASVYSSSGAPGTSGAASAGSPAVSVAGSAGSLSTGGATDGAGGKKGGNKGGSGGADTAGNGGSGNMTSGDAGDGSGGTSGGTTGGGGAPPGNTALGQYLLTWYSFQDNTPVNSLFSASGHLLIPFVSVAVPFTQLVNCAGEKTTKPCGTIKYGDKLYVPFLKDRVMPNGMKHTGWVVVDDYCGDGHQDDYCYPLFTDGKHYPIVDIYLGDFSKTGMKPVNGECNGPVGNGEELFDLSAGTPPSGAFVNNYGGTALGTGKCGDRQAARDQQYGPPAGSPFGLDGKSDGSLTECWGYDGQGPDISDCADCMPGVTCAK